MRLLVDTSAYSAFLRRHPGVYEEMSRADELRITPIVLGELLSGFRKGSRFEENLSLLRRFLASPRVDGLGVDDETADRYAVIQDTLRRQGSPIPTNDLWIAASALQHGLRLLTTDRHFRAVPQVVVNWHAP